MTVSELKVLLSVLDDDSEIKICVNPMIAPIRSVQVLTRGFKESTQTALCITNVSAKYKRVNKISDSNMDIYKTVVGALAKDNIEEYKQKEKVYNEIMNKL